MNPSTMTVELATTAITDSRGSLHKSLQREEEEDMEEEPEIGK